MSSQYWKETKNLVKIVNSPLSTTESLYQVCKAFVEMYDKYTVMGETTNVKNNKDLINYFYMTASNMLPNKALLRDSVKDGAVCKALLYDLSKAYEIDNKQALINIAKKLINKLHEVYEQIGLNKEYLCSFNTTFHRTKDGSIGYTTRLLIKLIEKDREDAKAKIMEYDSEVLEKRAEASGVCMGMFSASELKEMCGAV